MEFFFLIHVCGLPGLRRISQELSRQLKCKYQIINSIPPSGSPRTVSFMTNVHPDHLKHLNLICIRGHRLYLRLFLSTCIGLDWTKLLRTKVILLGHGDMLHHEKKTQLTVKSFLNSSGLSACLDYHPTELFTVVPFYLFDQILGYRGGGESVRRRHDP